MSESIAGQDVTNFLHGVFDFSHSALWCMAAADAMQRSGISSLSVITIFDMRRPLNCGHIVRRMFCSCNESRNRVEDAGLNPSVGMCRRGTWERAFKAYAALYFAYIAYMHSTPKSMFHLLGRFHLQLYVHAHVSGSERGNEESPLTTLEYQSEGTGIFLRDPKFETANLLYYRVVTTAKDTCHPPPLQA